MTDEARNMLKYCNELTRVLCALFPRLWKLSQSYFHGNLRKVVQFSCLLP